MYVMCDAKRVSMDTWQSPMRVDACVCGLWRCVRFNFYSIGELSMSRAYLSYEIVRDFVPGMAARNGSKAFLG